MKFSPLLFLMGQNRFLINIDDASKLLNIFMKYSVVYRNFKDDLDGKAEFTCSPYSSKKVEILCRKNNIEITKADSKGLLHILYLYRKRFGILLGMILSLFLIFEADNYIWSIDVTGNERVTYTEVVKELEDCGIKVGSKISDIDVDRAENLLLLKSDKISWITVNIMGTCANVQIREAAPLPEKESKNPANIVAKTDGQIEYLEVHKGFPSVVSGSAVKKGDLLISGVRDSLSEGFVVTRAKGKVYASTKHEFLIRIPLEYEQKNATGEKNIEKSLIFFSKEIKILKRCGNSGASCDTIDNVRMFDFFGYKILPFGVRTVKEVYYETEIKKLEISEAADIAFYKLEKEILMQCPDATITRKNINFEIGDDEFILRCKLECIEDIAKVVEFDFDEKSRND